jgi:hypothetical protein
MRYYSFNPRRYTISNMYRRRLISNYLARPPSAIKRKSWFKRHRGMIMLHGSLLGVPLVADATMFAVQEYNASARDRAFLPKPNPTVGNVLTAKYYKDYQHKRP